MKHTRNRLAMVLLLTLFISIIISSPDAIGTESKQVELPLDLSYICAENYTDHAALLIDGNEDLVSQALAESWPGDGSIEDPIIISNYRFSDPNDECINLWNVDLHWEISDCLIEGGPTDVVGVWFRNVSNGAFANNIIRNRDSGLKIYDGIHNVKITNNLIANNTEQGIVSLNGQSYIEISGNTFLNNGGNNIWITGGFNYSLVADNTIIGGMYGIRINAIYQSRIHNNSVQDAASDCLLFTNASNSTIDGNNLQNVTGNGLMTSCIFLTIADNTVTDCTGIGIYIATGQFNNISFNSVAGCGEYGLSLTGTTDNTTVCQNVFADNNGDGCQVVDDGEANQFMYNHFDDWITPDADADNIVDIAYELSGDAENEDPYPLVDPELGPPTPTTTGSTGPRVPMEIVLVAGGAVAVVLLVGIFIKRGR